jgi:hypothetical protein
MLDLSHRACTAKNYACSRQDIIFQGQLPVTVAVDFLQPPLGCLMRLCNQSGMRPFRRHDFSLPGLMFGRRFDRPTHHGVRLHFPCPDAAGTFNDRVHRLITKYVADAVRTSGLANALMEGVPCDPVIHADAQDASWRSNAWSSDT